MIVASGVRMGWTELPASVRAGVEAVLGDRVVEAVSQSGGFSPGTADRVRTTAGRRAFVKAAGAEPNPRTPTLHRREAEITAALPVGAPMPRLLGVHDDGDWVALVLSDVDGRHPRTPWEPAELTAVVSALGQAAADLTPSPLPDAPSAAERLAHDFAGWQRLADDPPADPTPRAADHAPWAGEHAAWMGDHAAWTGDHAAELAAAARRGLAALTGDTLVHGDIRADNLLIRPDGSVVIVDWPWACNGPPWLDTLLLAANVRVCGGDGEPVLAASTGVAARTFTDVLAGLTGFFVDAGRLPPVPGLPTVRAFQRAQGEALLPWLRERISRGGT